MPDDDRFTSAEPQSTLDEAPVLRNEGELHDNITATPTLYELTPHIEQKAVPVTEQAAPRDHRFWLVFFAIGISTAITALELVSSLWRYQRSGLTPRQSAIPNALPTIIHSLGGSSSFVWVGSAYSLAATACIPLCGGLAQVERLTTYA
jgi:uncharacterized membrane protein YfcA